MKPINGKEIVAQSQERLFAVIEGGVCKVDDKNTLFAQCPVGACAWNCGFAANKHACWTRNE